MQISPVRSTGIVFAVAIFTLSGCSASDHLSEREAHVLSMEAKEGATSAMYEVLMAANLDLVQPPEESQFDSCLGVDYSFDTYGQWRLSATVPIEPGTEASLVGRLGEQLALGGEWLVYGDENDSPSLMFPARRYVRSTDRTSDLSIDIEANKIAHVLNIRVDGDCFLAPSSESAASSARREPLPIAER